VSSVARDPVGLLVDAHVPAYELLQCRTAYATEYTAAIDLRKLVGELTVEPSLADGRY
jgi:hypothetical protein